MLFTPSSEQFEILYRGFIIGGHLIQQKGLTVLRRELSILKKLEDISKDCECGRLIGGTQEPDREYITGAISLDNKEFDLLYSYIASVPWSTGKSARRAVETLDALKDASQVSVN